jgi:DNA-directed RNA polymerase specialized sigma24 family protein
VLAVLRPLEREVLLRFHQNMESVREIALATDMPEGTVKSHLSRARRRLAELPSLGDEQ